MLPGANPNRAADSSAKGWFSRESREDRLRCSTYCPVASKCSTYQAWLKGATPPEAGNSLVKPLKDAVAAIIPESSGKRKISPQDVERGDASVEELVMQGR